MSLTRKMLKSMELDESKIDQIIEAHQSVVEEIANERDALKSERDELKAQAEELANTKKELVKAQAKLEEAEETAKKLNDLQEEYKTYKADVDAKAVKATKEKAYRNLLKDAGISEKRFDAILKVSDLSSIELDDDGNVKDSKAVVDSIKNEWADFIGTEGTKGASTATPPEGAGSTDLDKLSDSEYYKLTYEQKGK